MPPLSAAITHGVGPVLDDGYAVLSQVLPGTTIGGMIVVVLGYNNSTITSVTISGEADPTRVTAANFDGVYDSFALFYLANNTAGGDKTITVTLSDAVFGYGSMVVMEYLGQDTSSQPDATTTSIVSSGGGGAPTISITTATAGDLIISTCSSNGGKPTMPSGYSDLNLSNPGYYANAADNVAVGVAGGKTLVWTDVNDSYWGVNAVAFKAASVGAAGVIRHRVIGQ